MIEIRTILAPTDFSTHAATAVRYACGLAERFDAILCVLHVLPEIIPTGPDPMLTPVLPPDFYAEREAQARAALPATIDPAWGRPVTVVFAVRWGEPVDAIVDEARGRAADLVVIATHGRTGLSHALLGSVAERIVREAPCPVLTIRDRSKP